MPAITDIDIGHVLFTSDDLFLGTRNDFLQLKINFLSPQNELSDINKTYIDIGNGQMFELLISN